MSRLTSLLNVSSVCPNYVMNLELILVKFGKPDLTKSSHCSLLEGER